MPSERYLKKPMIAKWATVAYIQKSWLAGLPGIKDPVSRVMGIGYSNITDRNKHGRGEISNCYPLYTILLIGMQGTFS